MVAAKISSVSDVPVLASDALTDLRRALPRIRKLAASDDWREREVAATVLVEATKRNPDAVLRAMEEWACDKDENIRRAASESLRGLARTEPAKILHVLQTLNDDESLYVRKSVASMLRNASNKHAEFVLEVARRWATRSAPRTNWIIKEGLKKLRTSHSDSVARLLASLQPEHSSGSS